IINREKNQYQFQIKIMRQILGRRSDIYYNFLGLLKVITLMMVIQLQNVLSKEPIEVYEIPKTEFYLDHTQKGHQKFYQFQLTSVSNFYLISLNKQNIQSSDDSKTNSQNQNQATNNNSTNSDNTENNNDQNEDVPSCSLNFEGGEFEIIDNFEIYQNIISNMMQVSRSDNEYYYFYLDNLLQLYTYRVNTKKETLKYLGHKKIEFEDFILNSTDPSNPQTVFISYNHNANDSNSNQEDGASQPNQRLRRNLQLDNQFSQQTFNTIQSRSFMEQSKKEEYIIEQTKRKLSEDKEEEKFQQIKLLKLLNWKDQIICVVNQSIYIIYQDKAQRIYKFDTIIDIDILEDLLFVASGTGGLKVFEIQQNVAGSSQGRDIYLKKIASIKWQDQYVRKVLIYNNRIYFVNKDSIYIYTLQGKTINFGCLISENEIPENLSIGSLQAQDNTLIALTYPKVNDLKNVTRSQNYKGYVEFLLNREILGGGSSNGANQGNFYESQGQCYYKIKQENDLPNIVKGVQIINNYILFGLENGMSGVQLGVTKSLLQDIQKGKWINNFIPNASNFKVIEGTQYLIAASATRLSLYQFQDYDVNIACKHDQILKNGSLVNYIDNKQINADHLEYIVYYLTNNCIQELSKQNGVITKQNTDINAIKSYFGYTSHNQNIEVYFYKQTDNSTCVIKQNVLIKQLQQSTSSGHGFFFGMVSSFVVCSIILLLVYILYKRKQQIQKKDLCKTPLKKNRQSKLPSQKHQDDQSSINKIVSKKSTEKDVSSKKDNPNNQSSASILTYNKNGKNTSAVFEDDNNSNNHHNQSNHEHFYQQNGQQKANKEELVDQDQQNLQQQQKLLDQQIQQMLLISQQQQQQYIQQIIQNPQFQQLSKYEQDRFLQHQYQQHLEYQRQIRLQQIKQHQQLNQQLQNQQKGGRNKLISPLQRKYGGNVDPILETDSDKKMSTRRDQEAFYRMKKRNNHYEENLMRSYKKNINVINDLNLNIQLEENVQPPSHNVFSPQNFQNVQIELDDDKADPEQQLTANMKNSNNFGEHLDDQGQNDYTIQTENQQIQNPKIPFMTLQSIQNSLKQNQQKNNTPKKKTKMSNNNQYEQYEDDSDQDEESDHVQQNEEEPSQIDQYAINQQIQHVDENVHEEKGKMSAESEIKTSESQTISDKMTRSNNETTSTASNRQLNVHSNKNYQQKQYKQKEKEVDDENEDENYHNSLNEDDNQQDNIHLNKNMEGSESIN
ncbi:transmembrane protein, putative, partial (macronuclear) [Tetrahymena thermophila SB210]